MNKISKLVASAVIAGTATFAAGTANAWWGNDYWDGPWGYPGYGWGGYPAYTAPVAPVAPVAPSTSTAK